MWNTISNSYFWISIHNKYFYKGFRLRFYWKGRVSEYCIVVSKIGEYNLVNNSKFPNERDRFING